MNGNLPRLRPPGVRRAPAAVAVGALLVLVAMTVVGTPAHGTPAPEEEDGAPGFVVPDDTWLGEQWSLFGWGQTVGGVVTAERDVDVRAPEAWSVTRGDPDVVVAVIDSGVDLEHPDLVDNLWTNAGESGDGREDNGIDDDGNGYVDDWRGWDFTEGDNAPYDARGAGQSGERPVAHGTSLAGIIAADDNGWGMVGLAPDARVMAIRSPLQGPALGEALDYAADNGARIVNLSFGNLVPGMEAGLDDLHRALLDHPELLYVAAAMNVSVDQDVVGMKPCAFEDVAALLCVAATDQTDALATFYGGGSGYGADTVDLAAPGDNMLVPQPPSPALWSDTFDDGLAGWVTAAEPAWTVADGGHADVTAEGDEADDAAATVVHQETEAPVATGSEIGVLELAEPIELGDRVDCRLSGWVSVQSSSTSLGLSWAPPGAAPATARWILSAGVDGFGFVGSTDGEWQRFDLPVHDLVRSDGTVRFRFHLQFLPGGSADASFRVDDLALSCQDPGAATHTERDFAYAEGTSYATPMVAAAAALVWSAHPDLTAEQVSEAILAGVHPVDELAGAVRSGGRLDAYGALLAADDLAGGGDGQPDAAARPGADSPGEETTASGGLIGGMFTPATPQTVPDTRGGAGGSGPGDDDPAAAASTDGSGGTPPFAGWWWATPALINLLAAGLGLAGLGPFAAPVVQSVSGVPPGGSPQPQPPPSGGGQGSADSLSEVQKRQEQAADAERSEKGQKEVERNARVGEGLDVQAMTDPAHEPVSTGPTTTTTDVARPPTGPTTVTPNVATPPTGPTTVTPTPQPAPSGPTITLPEVQPKDVRNIQLAVGIGVLALAAVWAAPFIASAGVATLAVGTIAAVGGIVAASMLGGGGGGSVST